MGKKLLLFDRKLIENFKKIPLKLYTTNRTYKGTYNAESRFRVFSGALTVYHHIGLRPFASWFSY